MAEQTVNVSAPDAGDAKHEYFIKAAIQKKAKDGCCTLLTERPDLEENPPSEAQNIADAYNLNDWHNLTGREFNVRQKDYRFLKEQGESGKEPSGPAMYRVLDIMMYYSETQNLEPR